MMKRMLSILVFLAFISVLFNLNAGDESAVSTGRAIGPTRIVFEVNEFTNEYECATLTYPTAGSNL